MMNRTIRRLVITAGLAVGMMPGTHPVSAQSRVVPTTKPNPNLVRPYFPTKPFFPNYPYYVWKPPVFFPPVFAPVPKPVLVPPIWYGNPVFPGWGKPYPGWYGW